MQELLDWHVSTGCAAHDAHNSLKWSLEWFTNDSSDVLRHLHIAIESLQNGYDLLHEFLPAFVAATLTFDDTDWDDRLVSEHWAFLGVDSEVAQVLAELNLRWDGGPPGAGDS